MLSERAKSPISGLPGVLINLWRQEAKEFPTIITYLYPGVQQNFAKYKAQIRRWKRNRTTPFEESVSENDEHGEDSVSKHRDTVQKPIRVPVQVTNIVLPNLLS